MSVVMSAKAIHGLSPGGTAGTLRGIDWQWSKSRKGGWGTSRSSRDAFNPPPEYYPGESQRSAANDGLNQPK